MAFIASLALLSAAIFAVCCLLLAAFIGSLLYMVVLHHRLKAGGLAREQALLQTPLPSDSDLPHVVVQIPSFNEGPVLRRGVEAAAGLDWPRDRLHRSEERRVGKECRSLCDWSSDVCSSDLSATCRGADSVFQRRTGAAAGRRGSGGARLAARQAAQIGRASCRERV